VDEPPVPMLFRAGPMRSNSAAAPQSIPLTRPCEGGQTGSKVRGMKHLTLVLLLLVLPYARIRTARGCHDRGGAPARLGLGARPLGSERQHSSHFRRFGRQSTQRGSRWGRHSVVQAVVAEVVAVRATRLGMAARRSSLHRPLGGEAIENVFLKMVDPLRFVPAKAAAEKTHGTIGSCY
jgi:hypothetical protein